MIMEKCELKNEVMPMFSNLLIEFYDENPYEKRETETGLKLTTGTFDNPDTGVRDRKSYDSSVAKVIETGPEVRYIKPGDDIICRLDVLTPVCFKGNYYFTLDERNVKLVLGNNLSERFKKD